MNNRLKRANSTAITVIAAAALGYAALSGVTSKVLNNRAEEYIRDNIENVIEIQEGRTGLEHVGRPSLVIGPRKKLKRKGHIRPYYEDANVAYNHEANSLVFPLDGNEIVPEKSFVNKIAPYTCFGKETTSAFHKLRNGLGHELGHYYADMVAEAEGIDIFTGPAGHKQLGYIRIGEKMVHEGIAEYFERSISGKDDDFCDCEWKEIYDILVDYDTPEEKVFLYEFEDRLELDGGYNIVNKAIKEYGREAVKYFLENPPLAYDLNEIPEYKQIVMNELSVLK